MTILIKGTLSINTRGIAMLHCDVGHFLVEHASLKDVAVGKHTGFFEIQKIQPHVTGSLQGQLQLVMRATLKHMTVQTTAAAASTRVASSARYQQTSLFADTDQVSVQCEAMPDALDEVEAMVNNISITDRLLPVSTATVCDEDMPGEVETIKETVTPSQEVALSLDMLLPTTSESLPEEVELDPTLPRDQLRAEIQRLKAARYQFDSNRQIWQHVA